MSLTHNWFLGISSVTKRRWGHYWLFLHQLHHHPLRLLLCSHTFPLYSKWCVLLLKSQVVQIKVLIVSLVHRGDIIWMSFGKYQTFNVNLFEFHNPVEKRFIPRNTLCALTGHRFNTNKNHNRFNHLTLLSELATIFLTVIFQIFRCDCFV